MKMACNSKSSHQSKRTRSERKRFKNAAQRIVDARRSQRQSLSPQGEQLSVPVVPSVVEVQPQLTLTGDVISRLAAAVADAVRYEIGDADRSQRQQVSNNRFQEKEDESYIPPHHYRTSGQLGSDKNENKSREDKGESILGRKYAWYRTPSNPEASFQQGTHIGKGWTETVYHQTDCQPASRESVAVKRIFAKSRLGKTPSLSSLKIQEGEGESIQAADRAKPDVYSLKGKSPHSSLPPKVPENQKIRFSWKTPFVPEIAASPAKRVKFPPHLTYKGETCPNI